VQLFEAHEISTSRLTSLEEYVDMHTEEIAKMKKLCRNYQLHSAYLDGTVNELLQQVVNLLVKDHDSLKAQVKHQREDSVTLLTRLKDLREKSEQKLDQQTKDGN
jgi:dsDNA-specific endonuclease/ATPase MutS2